VLVSWSANCTFPQGMEARGTAQGHGGIVLPSTDGGPSSPARNWNAVPTRDGDAEAGLEDDDSVVAAPAAPQLAPAIDEVSDLLHAVLPDRDPHQPRREPEVRHRSSVRGQPRVRTSDQSGAKAYTHWGSFLVAKSTVSSRA